MYFFLKNTFLREYIVLFARRTKSTVFAHITRLAKKSVFPWVYICLWKSRLLRQMHLNIRNAVHRRGGYYPPDILCLRETNSLPYNIDAKYIKKPRSTFALNTASASFAVRGSRCSQWYICLTANAYACGIVMFSLREKRCAMQRCCPDGQTMCFADSKTVKVSASGQIITWSWTKGHNRIIIWCRGQYQKYSLFNITYPLFFWTWPWRNKNGKQNCAEDSG